MHQIVELSIEKVEVRFLKKTDPIQSRFLLPEKFKTHTPFSFSTAFLNIFFPGSWDLLTWQPWCCNMAMLSKGHLTGIISGIPATSVPRDSDQIRLEIPSLTIFDYLCHSHLLANFNTSHHITRAELTLIVGLPPRLTSFWIISSQIFSQNSSKTKKVFLTVTPTVIETLKKLAIVTKLQIPQFSSTYQLLNIFVPNSFW